ncbi:MAG: hypothetical protein E7607_03755 [Ruminococcaceae bacterium]|nr:hypothetical protein [Oscillospiraceae bacterium]
MGDIIRFCGIGLLCAISGIILRQVKGGELSLFIRIGGALIIFGAAMLMMKNVISELLEITDGQGLDIYSKVLIKALGLALLTKICSDICRDCGEGTLASGVELCGKLAILLLCIPMIGELMDYAKKILGV